MSAFGPDQVPAEWKAALFWLGIALALFAVILWPLAEAGWKRWRSPRITDPKREFKEAFHERVAKDPLSQAALDRAAYEREKLFGGAFNPIGFGARLLEKDDLAKRKAERRRQIGELRDALVKYGDKPDYQFRGHIERVRAFADIQRHLGENFTTDLHRQRTTWSKPSGAHHGHLAHSLLKELDRLEEEWIL